MKRTPSVQRIAVVDVLRALTLFLMLFTNDVPELKENSYWLIPAFLFCMGLSISFAVQNRNKRGDSLLQISSHLIGRTATLLIMGIVTANNNGVAGLSPGGFSIFMVIGFFLIWGTYPKARGSRTKLFLGMKVTGVVLLGLLLLARQLNGELIEQNGWGMLGLIGWAYLVCATLYLLIRKSIVWNALVWLLFIVLAILNHTGVLPLPFIPGDITLYAFGMSGVFASVLMQRYGDKEYPGQFLSILLVLGIAMLIAAFASQPFWIIVKMQATSIWFFVSLSLLFPLFGFLYWLTEVQGKAYWFTPIRPAGVATLTCYILPYLWYSSQQLFGWHYSAALTSGALGVFKSILFSFIIIGLAGVLMKVKFKLKV